MPRRPPTLDDLRRHAVARTLFSPTTLGRAITRLGFVQADPIRAPARAQDLTLRHRVADYTAGELERRYPKLAVDEDSLVNYGFLPRTTLPLLHPRTARRTWDAATLARAADVLAYIREHGATHPRELVEVFAHGRTRGYWGGMQNATTHLLDGMHYRGMLRVVRRDAGIRVYAAVDHPPADDSPAARAARAQALLELVVRKYAPLPSASLGQLVSMLIGYGAPQLRDELGPALADARSALPSAEVDGMRWYWPDGEDPRSSRWEPDDAVRLLAPFDPVVWDRRRFERLWGWDYRFEAYTPAPKRRFGYYALPLLWRDQVVGWANVARSGASARAGLDVRTGFIDGAPKAAAFRRELALEMDRLRAFLGHDTPQAEAPAN